MYVMCYASMLRCYQLIRLLVRTNHPCLRVGHHSEFLFGLKACADLELLVRIARVDWNFLIVSLLLTVHLLIDGLLIGCRCTICALLD
jgi:hypothetical protein